MENQLYSRALHNVRKLCRFLYFQRYRGENRKEIDHSFNRASTGTDTTSHRSTRYTTKKFARERLRWLRYV